MTDEWPSTGTLLATRYRLVALLETGGMAQIWHASDELLGRPVAIKLPTGPQVAWREARMAAKLSHPGIAAVHDFREAVRADGTIAPFVVMELLAGETVAARLVRETFGWPEAARVGAAVADALAAAHQGGVVHRDIKPGNVMLTPTGVKILDFGISAAPGEPDDDDTGATFGTPAYVAPERLDGMPAEPATDVYGLGVLLFEMVTGQPPYPVETWEELDEARANGAGTLPPSLPAEFRAVVERCLAEDPADRPRAAEVRFDLTALWLADEPESDDQPAAAKPTLPAPGPSPSPSASPSASPSSSSAAPAPLSASLHGSAEPSPIAFSTGAASSPGLSAAPPSRPGADPSLRPGGDPSARPDWDPSARPGAERPPVRRPRVAEAWPSHPQGPPRPGEPHGFPAGRVSAAALPMAEPQPRRRLALALAVLALLVTAGGIYVVINRPKERTDATPPAPSRPATMLFSSKPAAVPPTAPSGAAAPPASPSPSPRLSFDDAVSRLRAAVEDGAEDGDIRGDVATDLLNLIRPLQNTGAGNVDSQVAELRRKIASRAGEGSLSSAQAAILKARLTDLDRASSPV
ncbi:protein kinase [Paractinoplanes rhizophilus]|uniref:non-specific serine/threonine protein kinase n=1 Tax=Paractinoplanes rhizophilus TaxID=1416877 RepID=A0ABW2HGN7_9ACTN